MENIKFDYDVIVIGGGTAGLTAYRTANKLGKKVLIIESNRFVTTCANVGCMPSKLLIAASDNMHEIKKSKQFGINVENVSINNNLLWNRIRTERDRFVGFVENGANLLENKIIGHAKFISPHTILVNNTKITAKSFVLATGSQPFIPSIFNDFSNDILTNENIFELEKIPNSMAIIGAGVIGLELGFAFNNLNTEITFFNKSNKILKLNSELNEYILRDIQNQGMNFETNNIKKIEKINNIFYIHTENKIYQVEKILITAGRKTTIDNLNLDYWIGKKINPLELYNRETTQIGNFPIFLAGDINNDVTLLHEANKEGLIAGENSANYPNINSKNRNTLLSIIFTQPQIMQVGNTEQKTDTFYGHVSFEDQGRSRVMLKNKGMLNIYFNRKNNLLIGAEMFGPDAEHIAHMIAWLIEKETTLDEFLEFPFYHPVIEEGIRTAIRDAKSKI